MKSSLNWRLKMTCSVKSQALMEPFILMESAA